MTTAHASAARTSAAPKAAPPVMRAPAPLGRTALPPLASLAAIPAGPVVQRECAACEAEDKEPGLQRRLNAAASAASVQRKCAACESEEKEQSSVQPRLEVGPVGDRYEQEADSIAARVMAMRDSDVTATAAGESVQRACSACSSSREEPRARRFADADQETDFKVRARRAGGGETIAASDAELTSGGSEMPAATRAFFENRMGRDLGHVRIHSGSAAQARNDSISARAFTYKNHVWLGAGESASPTFTMAHELAHVMQQTAPGPVGPAPQRVQRIDCDAYDSNLFFAPVEGKQLEAEQNLISQLTKGTGIIGEAPVPNANKSNHGPDALYEKSRPTQGRADLMRTNNGRFVGFSFVKEDGASSPRPWYSPDNTTMGTGHLIGERLRPATLYFDKKHPLHIDGKQVAGSLDTHTAPTWKDGATPGFERPGDGPTEIEMGEVKFGGTPNARSEARAQLEHYRGGFKFVHRGYENIRQNITAGSPDLEKGTRPSLPAWNLKSVDMLTKISGAPEEWTAQPGTQELLIAKWKPEYDPVKKENVPKAKACDVPAPKGGKGRQTFKGKLYHGHDSELRNVWLYAWHPDVKPPQNTEGSAKFVEQRTKARKLYDELMATPAADAPRKRPRARSLGDAGAMIAPASSPTPTIVRRGPKKAKAKPVPTTDPFAANYEKWKADQKALSGDFSAYSKTQDYKLDAAPLLLNQAIKNTVGITGKSPNKVDVDKSTAMQKLEKDWRNLDILAGTSGALLGTLRKTFGSAFVKVINIYKSLRARFEKFWEKRKTESFSKKSRLAAAVMKVGGMIFAAIVHNVLPKIGHLLVSCVEQGFTSTIEKLFGDEFRAQIGDKIDEVEKKLIALETEIETRIEEAVGNVFSGVTKEYERIMAVWDDVGTLIGIAKTAFNIARLAACAATGIETVGIGCVVAGVDFLLSLFDVSPSERLAESLLGTCAAQELIGDYVLSIQEVKNFPTTAAQSIVDFVAPLLPSVTVGSYTLKLSDMLCKTVSGSVDMPKTSEVICGQDGSMAGQPHGKDWRVPPTVDPAILNRKPTDAEILTHGRLPLPGMVPKAPAQSPPPTTQPPAGGTPAGGGGDGTGHGVATGSHGIEEGSIKTGGHSVNVNYYIHGIGGGFSVKDYGGKVMTVRVTAVDSDAIYYGPDTAEIKVYSVFEDPKRKGVHQIIFEPVKDYLLWFRSEEMTTKLGFSAKKRTGQVGGAK